MKRQVKTLTRDVTQDEAWWLTRTLKKGEVLFVYSGCTYGAITPDGTPMSEDGDPPFFEVPKSALGSRREAE